MSASSGESSWISPHPPLGGSLGGRSPSPGARPSTLSPALGRASSILRTPPPLALSVLLGEPTRAAGAQEARMAAKDCARCGVPFVPSAGETICKLCINKLTIEDVGGGRPSARSSGRLKPVSVATEQAVA